jgi:serine/threonine protein kinase
MTNPDWLQPNAVINAQGGSYHLMRRLGKPSMEGVVFEARYRHLLRCAVKFIDPSAINRELLTNEVSLLSLLRHTHLVRITDFGIAEGDQQKMFGSNGHLFYITTEYIPGRSFDEAWTGLDAPDYLALLRQLLEAVAYMHNSGVLHMDLKPQNVMVDERAKKAVLIDLGFSLVVNLDQFRKALSLDDADLKGVSDTDDVVPVATERYVRDERKGKLRSKISRQTLEKEWFPDHDLFALAVLIQESIPHVNFAGWKSAQIGLQIIVDKIKHREYLSAASVRDDVYKLEPQYLAPLGVRELSHIEGGRVHIALSAHPVYLSDRILTVASHPLCQRLRYIPQLELEYLLYPDAKQSRFSHSLSAYELCREALNTWLADVRFRLEISPQDIEAILLFALLHDIGHYPLSHMFEDYRPSRPSPP